MTEQDMIVLDDAELEFIDLGEASELTEGSNGASGEINLQLP